MNVASMVALQVLGGVILTALMIARVVVARRKHWLPYYSERFGVAAFSAACAVGIALTIYWTVNGARQLGWEKQGLSESQIRLRLLTPAEFKGVYITTSLCAVSMWLGKASFLAIYAPSYSQFSTRIRRLFQVAVVFTALSFIAVFGMYILYCLPIERNWKVMEPDFCATVLMAPPLITAMVLSCASDLLLFSLPLILVLNLGLNLGLRSRGERYGVVFLLALGAISITVNIYRVIDADVNGYISGTPLPLSKRNVYINGEVVTTVTLLGAFSMPSLRLLFRHSRRGRGRGNQSYGTGMDGLGSDERAAEMRTMTKDGEIVGDRKRLYSVELQANV